MSSWLQCFQAYFSGAKSPWKIQASFELEKLQTIPDTLFQRATHIKDQSQSYSGPFVFSLLPSNAANKDLQKAKIKQ